MVGLLNFPPSLDGGYNNKINKKMILAKANMRDSILFLHLKMEGIQWEMFNFLIRHLKMAGIHEIFLEHFQLAPSSDGAYNRNNKSALAKYYNHAIS